jgi:prepilin-type N-terminal cleavage/methylation domain-containing protein
MTPGALVPTTPTRPPLRRSGSRAAVGFTLVELLVVIAIIGVRVGLLCALMAPLFAAALAGSDGIAQSGEPIHPALGKGESPVAAQAAVGKNVVLVAENQPRAVIVLAADADEEGKSAALFLQASVTAATGAELPIVTADAYRKEQTGIFVGAEAVRRLGRGPLAETFWGYQEIGGALYLMGGGPRCLTVAVRRFLEDIAGMRWWFEDETLIPKRNGLSVPAGSSRSAEAAFVRAAVRNTTSPHGIAATNYTSFCRYAAHQTLRFAPPAKYFAAHPDWYAEKGGKRAAAAEDFCMTSPDLAGLVDEYVSNMLAEIRQFHDTDVRLFGMGREDNAEWCQCVTCRAAYAAGSQSDVYMAFVNRVAERVEREFPDVLIVSSAYQAAAALPKKEMPRRNVLIWFCTEGMDYSKSIHHPANKGTREIIEGWHSVAAHIGIWHYLRGFERYRGRYDGAGFAEYLGPDWPAVSQRVYPEFVTFMRENGVEYFFAESESSFLHRDAAVMKHWMLNQTLEDPGLKYEDVLRTFTDGYYGAAGGKVREYLAVLEAAQEKNPPYMWFFGDLMAARHLTLDACLDADARLSEAEAAVSAPEEKDSLDRVRYLRASTMDRMFIVKWPAFRREWRLARSGAEFPVRPDDLVTRARAAGEWYGRVVKKEKPYADLTAKWIAFAQRRFADDVVLPVPQQLADAPAADVFQVPAQSYCFDVSGAQVARQNADFNLGGSSEATGALVETSAAPGGRVLAFDDPVGELTWTKLKTWGGEDNASTARAQVAALSGGEFQLIRLGRYDFDTVNSGLVFGLGKRRWTFFPLDLDRGAYEIWLNARYDASKSTLFIERLVARKQP